MSAANGAPGGSGSSMLNTKRRFREIASQTERLVFPLSHAVGRLFRWSQLLQQLADVARAQGVLAFAIDALIFAIPHPLYEREPHEVLAFRADRGF
jgi:hypothetical protein